MVNNSVMSDYETNMIDFPTKKNTRGNSFGAEKSSSNDTKSCIGRSTIKMFHIKAHSLASFRNPS